MESLFRIIRATALVIEDSMSQFHKEDSVNEETKSTEVDDKFACFREDWYLKSKPSFMEKQPLLVKRLQTHPSSAAIQFFIETLCEEFLFNESTVVCALIYINRLISLSNTSLVPTTWRPIVLAAFLLSHKMIFDVPYSNAEFADVYPILSCEELMRVEWTFFCLIQFRGAISLTVYKKYVEELYNIVPLEEAQAHIAAQQANCSPKTSPRRTNNNHTLSGKIPTPESAKVATVTTALPAQLGANKCARRSSQHVPPTATATEQHGCECDNSCAVLTSVDSMKTADNSDGKGKGKMNIFKRMFMCFGASKSRPKYDRRLKGFAASVPTDL
eukprot:GILK01008626.1.p1 GENE.GILK01008626.1~~GILK01008626.1.p1  ORF type:complete len:352 (+),score=50.57 GILK01008626.1:68-1057(+)